MSPTVPLVGRNLSVTRAGRAIIDDVSIEAQPGRITAVTGSSGAGKSTLLSVLAGVLEPDSGEVQGRPALASDHSIGIVLQGHGLLPILTAAENVELPLQIRGVAADTTVQRAREALRRAALPDHDDRLVEDLSGGQQQRVSVARALVVEPILLVADEPTSELDAVTRDLVLAALRAEADRGVVVVIATHDEEVVDVCDLEVHLVDGRIGSKPATT